MKFKAENHNLLYFEKVDSTNETAEKLLFAGDLKEYTIIFTDSQLKGKGVGRNSWQSEPGKNILMSIVLHPEFLNPADQFMINKVASLAVCRCLDKFIPEKRTEIKWPNDIYLESRKIAGILSKNIILGSLFSSCIVGIGLNVNQLNFNPELPNPVSMAQVTGKKISLELVLNELIHQIKAFYELLKKGEIKFIDQEYLFRMLNFNKKACYISKERTFEGIIRGVDQFGLLELESDGEMIKYDMKEIALITKNKTYSDENQ
ncbi:MAG: biotin--[acetyl-CoA-carboxylase] ligase [Bacteroidales bacterium]|nr:biotin--[acetyl-CoA-carboxylase] ligase [Bacteroidales bacterium]